MNNKVFIWILFVLMVAAQIFAPASMVIASEDTLATGQEFKFRTEPVDPTDLFRGRYITLNFSDNSISPKGQTWKETETVYATIGNDDSGFAYITDLSRDRPQNTVSYLTCSVRYSDADNVTLNFPFNRFYMEESKAPEAEKIYNRIGRLPGSRTYALVCIKKGNSVLKDVVIDGVPIGLKVSE